MPSTKGGAPKYARIADTMRQRIARGTLPHGTRLPANEALAEEFGVSRVTVRQAVDLLVAEGLVEPRQGAGEVRTKPEAAGQEADGDRVVVGAWRDRRGHRRHPPGDVGFRQDDLRRAH